MKFTIKTLLLVTAWVGWCLLAVLSGRLWVYDVTEFLAWLILSSTLALPFISTAERRPFWSIYATTAAVFLILIATENEMFVRLTNNVARKLIDAHIAIFGNQEGLGNHYLKTAILGIMLRFHSVPFLGLFMAYSWRKMLGVSHCENAG